MAKELGITKEYLMQLIAEEKEALAAYEQSCTRFKITPNSLATSVAAARIELLQDLMRGEILTAKMKV